MAWHITSLASTRRQLLRGADSHGSLGLRIGHCVRIKRRRTQNGTAAIRLSCLFVSRATGNGMECRRRGTVPDCIRPAMAVNVVA